MKALKSITLSIVGTVVIVSICTIAKEPTWLWLVGVFSWGIYCGLKSD